MESEPVIKQSRLLKVGALFVLLVVGGIFSLPCLCVEGSIAGRYKMILLFLIFTRLAWGIYKRTFRFRDYFIYFAIVIGFCRWADSLVH